MSKIAIDCDGVLAEFSPSGIRPIVNKLWPGRMPADYVPKDWIHSGILAKGDLGEIFKEIKATENFWLGLQPYPESIVALARWLVASKGHDVWIVTARAETAGMTVAKQTEIWLDSCGIRPHHNFVNVITVDDPNGKIDIYRAMGIQYSVDDKDTTVQQCQELDGHRAALLDRPWNQQADARWRVSSLGQFLDAIQ